jgi:gliding motility associated protien GldN
MVLLFALISGLTYAQVPEDIVTEGSDEVQSEFLDGIVQRKLIYESRTLQYDDPREADVPWERRVWRVIDVREKFNLPFAYPSEPFVKILFEAAQNGEIDVFQKDDFKDPLDPDEISQMLFRLDTVEVVDLETYETRLEITRSDLNFEDIKRIRIKEIWYFDEETSRVRVRILGISPIMDVYDDITNEFLYELPMFWVYYPQSREILTRKRAFVDGNDAAPMTWSNMLEQRKFSSYIIKITNQFDNRIKDFAYLQDDPMEQLYESEKIKHDLFNFEHDLWSW